MFPFDRRDAAPFVERLRYGPLLASVLLEVVFEVLRRDERWYGVEHYQSDVVGFHLQLQDGCQYLLTRHADVWLHQVKLVGVDVIHQALELQVA